VQSVLSIRSRIAPLGWRVRWHRGVYWGTRWLHYSLMATLPLLLVKSLLPGPTTLWVLSIAIAGAGCGLSRPSSLSDLARLIEERLDLQARLSTALEYYDRQDRSPFALALYRDAFRILPPFRGKELLPVCLPRGRPGRGSAPDSQRDDGPESPDLMHRGPFPAHESC
jgi:hypothetical protein